MEPQPNPERRASTSNSTQSGELLDRVVEFIAEAPSIIAYGWNAYRRPIINVAIVMTLLALIIAVFDFLGSVNELIFFPTLFTVLGIIQVARFAYSRVLFAKDRQKLLQQVSSIKQELLGPSSVAGLLDSTDAIEVKAIAVSEPAVLEALVTPTNPSEANVSVTIAPPMPAVGTKVEEPMTQTVVPEAPEPPILEAELITDPVIPAAETVTLEEISSPEKSEEPETVAQTILSVAKTIEETTPSAAETVTLEEISSPEKSEEPETVAQTILSVAKTIEETTPSAAETVTLEEEIGSEETVLEAELNISPAPETPIAEEEASLPEPTVETATVEIVSESTPDRPQELEKEEDVNIAEETAADSSKATIEEQTPDKPLGFDTKTPKKSKKKRVAKIKTIATDTTKLADTTLTVEETERETLGQEKLDPIAPQSLPLDDLLFSTNGVDELRYLLLSSQVELLDSPEPLQGITYTQQSETMGIGVVNADGEKCERCWNYSTSVGRSSSHPTLCNRCIAALSGKF